MFLETFFRECLMPVSIYLLSRTRLIVFIGISLIGLPVAALAQGAACPTAAERPDTSANNAYGDGRYTDAEGLYAQALAQKPQDVELSAALVHTLLHEGKVSEASTQANDMLQANPRSAIALTAVAEVELRQGQPWLAMQSLDQATAADACYARSHLIRSRVLRINSMYTSERAEIQRAYDIDPADPDIQRTWQGIVSPAHEIEGIDRGLASMKDLDAETRQKAEASIHSTMPLLYENSQTCKVVPSIASAEFPLQPSKLDPKQIDGYKLEVQLPQSKAKLLVDTAASGLFISKALADQNGFKPSADGPEGTVHVDSLKVGPLEFRDCTVGVSQTPFAGDGFIGTDIFSSWLITLDYRLDKMTLAPLPKLASLLPGDRVTPRELADFMPVYHRRQYLLVPITFKDKSQKLFILATGMRYSAMTPEAAHSVSKITMNFTNSEQTTSGGRVQFYREIFDMQMGSLPQIHQGHVLEFDPSAIEHNSGFQVAGMLGLDILHSLTLHLDYRDGLVKFETTETEFSPGRAKGTMTAGNNNETGNLECQPGDDRDRPLGSTIEARVAGTLDSAHLKPGKEVWVQAVHPWEHPGCTLDEKATLYGHVIAANSSKSPNSSELSVVFDHADCTGRGKKQLKLRLIGLVAPPDESKHIHEVMPTEVAGGGRQISDTVAGMDTGWLFDDDLNPGGPPHTVHAGIVVRMPKVKLEPAGGPGCSARITSTDSSVRLGTGSELLLTMESVE